MKFYVMLDHVIMVPICDKDFIDIRYCNNICTMQNSCTLRRSGVLELNYYKIFSSHLLWKINIKMVLSWLHPNVSTKCWLYGHLVMPWSIFSKSSYSCSMTCLGHVMRCLKESVLSSDLFPCSTIESLHCLVQYFVVLYNMIMILTFIIYTYTKHNFLWCGSVVFPIFFLEMSSSMLRDQTIDVIYSPSDL